MMTIVPGPKRAIKPKQRFHEVRFREQTRLVKAITYTLIALSFMEFGIVLMTVLGMVELTAIQFIALTGAPIIQLGTALKVAYKGYFNPVVEGETIRH